MTSKEYLMQIYNLDHKIYMMQLEADEYRRLADVIPGGNYDKPFVKPSNRNTEAPFVKWINKALDKEKEIEKEIERLNNLKVEVTSVISQIDNGNYRMVLMLRYLKSMKIEEIAETMHYSIPSVKRWHREALEVLVVPSKYESLLEKS